MMSSRRSPRFGMPRSWTLNSLSLIKSRWTLSSLSSRIGANLLLSNLPVAETQYWDTPAAVEIKQSSAQAKPLQLPRSQNAHFQGCAPPHISSRSKDRVASSAGCGRLYRVPERMTTSRRLMRREDQVYASSMFNLPSNFNAVDICTTSAWQKSQTQTFFPSFFLRTSVLSIFVQPPPGGTRCSSVEPSQ